MFNRYPQKFIDKCIKHFIDNIHTNKPEVEKEVDENTTYLRLKLPFLGNMSNVIKRQIKKIVRDNIPNCNLRIVFASNRRIKHFFNFKDKIPSDLRSQLVYKIQCGECNLIYYGLAERHCKVRFYDHIGKSIYTGLYTKVSIPQ